MNNYTFGNYICELREKKGLSQNQLGEKLGISNKAISKWENGGAYPSTELMLPLARELDVSIEELYAAISNAKVEKNKMRKLLDTLTQKSKPIILGLSLFTLLILVLHVLLATTPNKIIIPIATLFAAILIYGMVRLEFWVLKKMAIVSKYIDLLNIILLSMGGIMVVLTVFYCIAQFPNGFSPMSGAATGLAAGILHSNKKRI